VFKSYFKSALHDSLKFQRKPIAQRDSQCKRHRKYLLSEGVVLDNIDYGLADLCKVLR
jgi:hypothetical protein